MNMKKIGQQMSLLMGLSMSCVLTLVGLLSAGKFTVQGFLSGFAVSFVVSMIIGLIIPMKKVSDAVTGRFNRKQGTLKARLLEALISDVLYSPLMTFIMVYIAWRQATAHGAMIPLGPMLLKSEIISFIAAFILSFVLTPVFMNMLIRKNRPE